MDWESFGVVGFDLTAKHLKVLIITRFIMGWESSFVWKDLGMFKVN